MLLRTAKRKEKPDWNERAGHYVLPKKSRPRVWLHCVSVGEVVAALPLMREIKSADKVDLILTVTTTTGHATARARAEGLYDHLFYFPLDIPRFVLQALARVKPEVIVLFETELWFNLLHLARNFGVTTMLANGRISDRSFRRLQKIRPLYRPIVRELSECLMQTVEDSVRIKALGASITQVVGNTKFDEAIQAPDPPGGDARHALGIPNEVRVIVIGSTRGEPEESFVLDALGDLPDDVWVVHAPRHVETADVLEERIRAARWPVARRSRSETGRYLILDTYGELGWAYHAADLVIIGGGFEPLGGQNLLQPLGLGKPVLHGPHMSNFRQIADGALAAHATEVCETPHDLKQAVARLLNDEILRAERGQAAAAFAKSQAGASARYAQLILRAVDESKAFRRD